ncbi:MAG: hypothetical protein LUC94_01495 [Clostridiales bacterium]|nr:hypothetical protein [Clostridiales bacterium]
MKSIGIVCEGPTDYILLQSVTDHVLEDNNNYKLLQPEPNLMGEYGNGWKGVWKWCADNALIKEQIMKEIEPRLDFLIVQMDGDVSRKERISHCWCDSNTCEFKGNRNPLDCDSMGTNARQDCPLTLPCADHERSVEGYQKHLKLLITGLLKDLENTCVVIPCDSTDAWIVAAYDKMNHIERIENPWETLISKGKYYHGLRIHGKKKQTLTYREMSTTVCDNWEEVKKLCTSAACFESDIIRLAATHTGELE